MNPLTRRQFLYGASSAAGLLQAQIALKIRQVDIIHHTHMDVGYTELPSVVRDLQKRYLDVAVDACRADATFRWTVESLVGLDDWWRDRSAEQHNRLLALVNAGQMDVMGMPFNQTPFLNVAQWRQMMSWISPQLWKATGIRAAMQNDVNGFPRAGAMALLDHGIRHLLMGINADSGGPPFRRPTAFWWKLPDGRRLFVWLGEHYGSVMRYLEAARDRNHLLVTADKVRAANEGFLKRVREIEAEGYAYDRLILTFTHPLHYDNGAPFPSLGPFVAKWNSLGLSPKLRLTTATQAVLEMEKIVGGNCPEMTGEWTDWWANGDASGPREVAASRVAKRHLAAAESTVFGPMPSGSGRVVENVLRDLCLFDEHTWGASSSISRPWGLETIAQYGEKSELAYRPMGGAEALLGRRVRAKLAGMPQGVYAFNPSPAEVSGWATLVAPGINVGGLVDSKTGQRVEVRKIGNTLTAWMDKLAPHTMRVYRIEDSSQPGTGSMGTQTVVVDGQGWPRSATWSGMSQPLFQGAVGEFIATVVVPPADRRTIARLHANPDAAKRAEIRKQSFRETAAEYATVKMEETPHTVVYTQEILHPRLANASRVLELWRQEPRVRVTLRFDRISSLAPEVYHIGFTLPEGLPMPLFSCGGVPFTPYTDQLPGACRDYVGIDGWAHYRSGDGHRLWVTRDAPLVSIGRPHVVERHQEPPSNPWRILAMVFDNCWHTNFVADSHGTMEFQFDLVWRKTLDQPAAVAESIARDPILIANVTANETPAELDNLYRR